MNKRGLGLGEVMILFVGIIFALAILPQIFSEQATMTTQQSVGSEVLSIASIRNTTGGINDSDTRALDLLHKPSADDWQYGGGCSATGFILMNGSYDSMTLNTDYVVDTTYFNVTFNMSSDDNYGLVGINNNTYVNYTYCQDGYIQDSAARGITPLIGLFSVITLIAFALFYAYKELS